MCHSLDSASLLKKQSFFEDIIFSPSLYLKYVTFFWKFIIQTGYSDTRAVALMIGISDSVVITGVGRHYLAQENL